MIRRGAGLSRSQAAGLFRPGGVYRSGTRVGLPTAYSYVATNAVAADVMYAWPIPVEAILRVAAMEIQVGTSTPGISAKLGLALPGPDGLPLALVAECAAPVDFGSLADALLQSAVAGNPAVPTGYIWGLSVFNGAAQPTTAGQFGQPAGALGHFVGQASMSGYTGRGSVGGSVRVSRAHTYASAFPATLTGWTTANNVFSSPTMVAVAA